MKIGHPAWHSHRRSGGDNCSNGQDIPAVAVADVTNTNSNSNGHPNLAEDWHSVISRNNSTSSNLLQQNSNEHEHDDSKTEQEKQRPGGSAPEYDSSEELDLVPDLKKSTRVSVRSDTASVTSSMLNKSKTGGCSSRELYNIILREENREADAVERQQRVIERCKQNKFRRPVSVAFFVIVLGLVAMAMYFAFRHIRNDDND